MSAKGGGSRGHWARKKTPITMLFLTKLYEWSLKPKKITISSCLL
jgi:hypothetical protein